MSRIGDWMHESAHDVVSRPNRTWWWSAAVPPGMAAALAAARNGASVTLLERYNHLGGLASGGMVLVLDDMWDSHLQEISVRGVCLEMIERMAAARPGRVSRSRRTGAACPSRCAAGSAGAPSTSTARKSRTPSASRPPSIRTRFKRASLEMVLQADVNLRLHSWFSRTLVEDGQVKGVICETKSGREAILGKVVIDATGDLDVAASAGAPHVSGAYIVTTVFRLGGVDTDEAERFEHEEPAAFQALDREVKHMLGGAWDSWWLKTPLPGVVWCNCPHMAGLDGLKVADLTRAEVQGRATIHKVSSSSARSCPALRTAT